MPGQEAQGLVLAAAVIQVRLRESAGRRLAHDLGRCRGSAGWGWCGRLVRRRLRVSGNNR